MHYHQRHLHLLEPPLQLLANPHQFQSRGSAWPRHRPPRARHGQLPLPLLLERHVRNRAARGDNAPRRNDRGYEEEQVLQRPWRFELGADSAHGAVENEPVPPPAGSERDEQSDRAAEGLGVEEGRQGRVEASSELVEEDDAVFDDGIDVGDVGGKAVGEAVALMVHGAGGEAGFGEVDGGELKEPAGLAGEAVDEA